MSKPRPVVAGTPYKITRRTTQRQFWLRPCAQTTRAFIYCLAVAAEKYGVLIHSVCVMSNHYHLELTDVLGDLPQFTAWLHEHVAKCVNSHYGRWEGLWASGVQTSRVILSDDASFTSGVAYTQANPVEAALVERGNLWPGLRMCYSADAGKDLRMARRPEWFFRDEKAGGKLPSIAVLQLSRPPGFLGKSNAEVAAHLREAIIARERKLRDAILGAGRTFLGVAAIRATNPWDAPASRDPRRNLSPRVAGTTDTRVRTLGFLATFEAQYRACWDRWIAGDTDVIWPHGTYKMVAIHHCPVAPAPP